MNNRKRCVLALLVLLGSCARSGPAHDAAILERNSPAVGDGGSLVEDVGLETFGGVFTPLLKAGCATPCKVTEAFSTAQDNQSKFEISLFRGKGKLVSDTHPLGVCHVVNIPPAPRGMPQIDVTVEVAEKEVRVYAVDRPTGRPQPIQCGADAAGKD
jgi:molecular chaperone DnaK